MSSEDYDPCTINDLPEEILVYLFRFLSPESIITSVSLTCWTWNLIVRRESEVGRIVKSVTLDGNQFYNEFEVRDWAKEILNYWSPLRRLKLKNWSKKLVQDISEILPTSLKEVSFDVCDCTNVSIKKMVQLNSIKFDSHCFVPTRILEEISSSFPYLIEIRFPKIPSAFVPLIVKNHPYIQVLEVGSLSNELIWIICNYLKGDLKSFAFVGDQITYSGVAALTICKDTLQVLKIRDPKYLTKNSLCILARNLRNLQSLQLYWHGKLLLNNPWSFDYCHDRQEQRVDNLFVDGSLDQLTEVELSGFFQTVVDKTVQLMCAQHLSGESITTKHLEKVSLAHCFQVTDGGIQWLVGSRHSPAITQLDLSNTDLTGQCFLRRMPNLIRLSLDCCSSLSGTGLLNITSTCINIRFLSLTKNKQLTDEDFREAFKNRPSQLEELNLSYTNLSGECFSEFKCPSLKKLTMNCCSRFKDANKFYKFLENCSNLKFLDLSVTNITGEVIFKNCQLKYLKYFYIDFCPKLTLEVLKENLFGFAPNLKFLSASGTMELDQVNELKQIHQNLKRIVTLTTSTDKEMRQFVQDRDLHLTNWQMTKRHMVRTVQPMLSQIVLQSLQDR